MAQAVGSNGGLPGSGGGADGVPVHTDQSDSKPQPCPRIPPGLLSLGLTWGAGLGIVIRCWLSMGQPQKRGPFDGSHGIIWGIQLLARGSETVWPPEGAL